MADETSAKPIVETIPSAQGDISAIASATAPFIYFESAPFFGLLNGIGSITLLTSRLVKGGPDGTVHSDYVMVGHLRGNLEAMVSLRSALDGIILMATPKPEGPAN